MEPYPVVHRMCRRLILNVEVPLLDFVLRPRGGLFVTRNSLHSSRDFNLFMSDVDFSIVSKDQDCFPAVLNKRQGLKKCLPNLGECELYLEDEWELKKKLSLSPSQVVWDNIYLIRKLGWQKKSLLEAKTEYEKIKVRRAMDIILRRLGHSKFPLNGSVLFALPGDPPRPRNPQLRVATSLFLGATLGCEAPHVDLEFNSIAEFERFHSLLPDSLEDPQSPEDMEIKQYLLLNEVLISTVSLRLAKYEGQLRRAEEIEAWIGDLHKRGCPRISEALAQDC
jgi:hypothetical protein